MTANTRFISGCPAQSSTATAFSVNGRAGRQATAWTFVTRDSL